MKSIAEFKRAMTAGTTVTVTAHAYPDLNGERTVVKAQTNGIYLGLPADHPRAAEESRGGWFSMPKRDMIRFNVDGSVTIMSMNWTRELGEHVRDLMTITIKREQGA